MFKGFIAAMFLSLILITTLGCGAYAVAYGYTTGVQDANR